LLGDPDKTFCPVSSINSRREVKKFPTEAVTGMEGLKVFVFTMG
jgi:hypothetical protein